MEEKQTTLFDDTPDNEECELVYGDIDTVVYLLKMDNDTVKIGITDSIKKRIPQIEHASGNFVLEGYHTMKLLKSVASGIETLMHETFAQYRKKGEYFYITLNEARAKLEKHGKLIHFTPKNIPQKKNFSPGYIATAKRARNHVIEGIGNLDDGMAGEIKTFIDKKILPQYIWQLLTREERRKFFADGRLVLPDGLADLNKRRRARGGKENIVQHDVNLISGFLDGVAGKNFVRRNEIKRGDDTITEYIVYGSEYRQHISTAEVFHECFGSSKRKSMNSIGEVLKHLEGWHLEKRLQSADSVYPDQKRPYYRDADNVPAEEEIC